MTNETPQSFLDLSEEGAITVGSIRAETLDGTTVTQFGEELMAFAAGNTGAHILLDFQQVHYLSSAALTELLRANETLAQHGGSVRLCNLSDSIHKIFKITNLEKIFVIHEEESLESARRRFVRALEVAAQEDAWAGDNA